VKNAASGQSLVSIVTPVFNGAPWLRECIDSILAQTHSNWEYVIVNNCSTDASLEIAEEYARRDSRIKVRNNSAFLRVIASHNNALRHISPASSYCKLVFADDWLFPQCLERMIEVGDSHPTVGVIGAYSIRGPKVVWTGLPYPSTFVSGKQVCRAQLLGQARLPGGCPYIFGTGTAMMFRADLVRARNSFYNEGNLHADAAVCYEILRRNEYGFVHQVLTYIRTQEDSLTSFSHRVNTYLPWVLHDVLTYGPDLLTQDELCRAVKTHLQDYYWFLAERVIRHKDDGTFWRMHEAKLRQLHYPLNRGRLAMTVLRYCLDRLCHPKELIRSRRQMKSAHEIGA
jgi:glycosyltransferase involved in cell wall biosynthesis